MSWADDIRCLHCDGRLPLYRKITNGQFCSATHRKAYWAEQERLAVERLHQTHDSLRAYRPRDPIESILGPVEAPAELVELQFEEPVTLAVSNVVPNVASNVIASNDLAEAPLARFLRTTTPARPRWMRDHIKTREARPILSALTLRNPVCIYVPYDCGFGYAAMIALPFEADPAAPPPRTTDVVPVPVAVFPTYSFSLTIELDDAAQADVPAPLSEILFALDPGAPRVHTAAAQARPAGAIATAPGVQLPLDAAVLHAILAPAALMHAGLRELPMDRATLVPGPWIDSLRALDLRATTENPQFVLSTPPLRPRLRLASGRRYAVETRTNTAPARVAGEFAPVPRGGVALPERNVKVMRASAASAGNIPALAAPNFEPGPTGLLPLACAAQASQPKDGVRPAPALSIPQPLRTQPLRPGSKLEPIDVRPTAGPGDFAVTPPPYAAPPVLKEAAAPELELKTPQRSNVWTHAVDFWNRAPRDLKLLTFAIPVLLGLALHPALPKVRIAAPAAAGGIERNLQQAVNVQWTNVKQSVFNRAAIALDEDFRSGLDDWASRDDATAAWSFDATGFVRPGPLALYRPSLNLTDYQFQFLGMIDKKALSWVVRAADFNNYYVVKLEVLKSGPVPTMGITRYAVIDGKATARADTAVPVDARNDMLYRVRMEVQGSDFALSIQGQMIDAWSEPRLRHGGVGFFSARGEESRLRWVQVTHQYDMLGRLCAYLAPYNISTTSGGW